MIEEQENNAEVEEKTNEELFYPEAVKEAEEEVKEDGQDDSKEDASDKEEGSDEGEEASAEEESSEKDDKEEDDEKTEVLDGQLKFEIKDIVNPDEDYVASEDIERIVAEAKQRGLTKEQAQWAVNERADALGGLVEAFQDRNQEQVQEWRSNTEADKEVGGGNYDVSVRRANMFLDKFATPEMRQILDEGYGNHPEVIRLLSRAGATMEDDSSVMGGKTVSQSEKPLENYFYKE